MICELEEKISEKRDRIRELKENNNVTMERK